MSFFTSITILQKAHEVCIHRIPSEKISVEPYDYTIIIPYRKRFSNLCITYESIRKSIEHTSKRVHCIVFEHSEKPEAEQFCREHLIEYIYVPICDTIDNLEQFNRGLAFDMSVIYGLPAKGYVCHDVDIFIPVDFWNSLEQNCIDQKVSVLQTYANRCVNNIRPETTLQLHRGEVQYTAITSSDCLPRLPGSWGGSLYIEREAYFEIGGHDPYIFSGHAPEDKCFVHKCNVKGYTIGFANSPPIELYHQYHTPTGSTNPRVESMTVLFEYLKRTPDLLDQYINTKKADMLQCVSSVSNLVSNGASITPPSIGGKDIHSIP